MRKERLFLLLPFAVALGVSGVLSSAACGGSSGSGGSGTVSNCFDYSSFDGTSPAVSFKSDVLPIFRNSCGLSTSCHGSMNPPVPAQHYLGPANSAGDLTDAQISAIVAGIVGVQSVDEPGMAVVKAGDPANSFMMYKLDADPQDVSSVNCSKLACSTTTCGTAMPQTGNILPADERDTIRRWIAQGAQAN